jgi:hypothetical protein
MGKIFKEEFVFNKESLEFYIKKICIERLDTYFAELLNDIDILSLIERVVAKYGFLISQDVVEGLCRTEIMLLTWYEFNIALANQHDIKNSFMAFLYSRVFFRVNEQIKKERPTRFKSNKDKKDISEYKERGYSKNNYEYIEILSGDNYDLDLFLNKMTISNWNSNYGKNDFNGIEGEDNFENLIADLSSNQKNIIKSIYKYKMTGNELSLDSGVGKQSICNAKKRALKKLRIKLGVK